MVDEDDSQIIDTSIREMEEEIGVSADSVDILGVLRCDWTEVSSLTGVSVTPVVGFIGDYEKLNFKINRDEVISFQSLDYI
jgi:nudix motif 8